MRICLHLVVRIPWGCYYFYIWVLRGRIHIGKGRDVEKDEILRKANEIASPFGLRAEFLADDLFSVGVGGDERSYTQVINLIGYHPGDEILAKISRDISNTLPINRVTIDITDLLE